MRIFRLFKVYRELGMSSILWSTKPITKPTYGTLIHIDLNLEASMYGPVLCGNPFMFHFTWISYVLFNFHVTILVLLQRY